jgi:type II secretory pathway predicted ATPase ExeA
MSDAAAAVMSRPASIYGTIGLREDPFPPDPLAGAYVALPDHERVFDALGSWLATPDPGQSSLAVISGDSGTGKTRLFDRLAATLVDNDDRLLGIVPDDGSRRSDAQLLRSAISALGGAPTGRTGLELTTELRQILAGERRSGLPPVVLVDNAALTGSQLEILRNVLAPIAQDDAPSRVQIVLFGTPELPDRIARRRSLAGFVRHADRLEPLDLATTETLLQSRLDAVRIEPAIDAAALLSGAAIEIIWQTAGGNPGTALTLAHAAIREMIATGSERIGAGMAQTVVTAFANQVASAAQAVSPAVTLREDVVQTRLTLPGFEESPRPTAQARRRGRQQ